MLRQQPSSPWGTPSNFQVGQSHILPEYHSKLRPFAPVMLSSEEEAQREGSPCSM